MRRKRLAAPFLVIAVILVVLPLVSINVFTLVGQRFLVSENVWLDAEMISYRYGNSGLFRVAFYLSLLVLLGSLGLLMLYVVLTGTTLHLKTHGSGGKAGGTGSGEEAIGRKRLKLLFLTTDVLAFLLVLMTFMNSVFTHQKAGLGEETCTIQGLPEGQIIVMAVSILLVIAVFFSIYWFIRESRLS